MSSDLSAEITAIATAAHECLWHANDKQKHTLGFGTIGNPLGTPLPHRLEPGAQCYAVVDLATAIAVIDAPRRDPALGRLVWPVVQLGNGRKRKGNAVEVPVTPEGAAPPAKYPPASSRSGSGRLTVLAGEGTDT